MGLIRGWRVIAPDTIRTANKATDKAADRE